MKKILVVANWKANPASRKEATSLFFGIRALVRRKNREIVICPPNVYCALINGKTVKLGSQDVSAYLKGPFTGEVTASMLKSIGTSYCIVGHSERRKMGETNERVAEKIKNLLKAKIIPILCVGETARGQSGEHFKEISEMLLSSIKGISKPALVSLVIAYEPLWAISTQKNGAMEPEVLHETNIYIKKILTDGLGKKIASKIRIIYGGSVDPKNACDILEKGMAEGFLIGKASLNLKSFKLIADCCN